jgi:hypothetical protein
MPSAPPPSPELSPEQRLVGLLTTVITPTVPGREAMLAASITSARAAGYTYQLVQVDLDGAGPAQIRNALAKRASTPWLLCLDDDDTLMAHYATVVGPYLPDADVVYTAWELVDEQGAASATADGPWPLDRFEPGLLAWQNTIPVTAMIRASAFADVGGFPTEAAEEDWALWRALIAAGARFVCVPAVAWSYRQWPGSRSARARAAGRR